MSSGEVDIWHRNTRRGTGKQPKFGISRPAAWSAMLGPMTNAALPQPLPPPLRKVLVVQHVPHEPLGTLDRLLRARKVRIRFVNFARDPEAVPAVTGYDAVIVLGGPMNVTDEAQHPHLRTEMRLLEAALAAGVPILGICLGAQLLAHVLGAHVGRNQEKELGWHPVSLTPAGLEDRALRHLAPAAQIFHWHGDTFALPSGAEQLAHSPLCPQQAFRYGPHAYGLQFHLEADPPLIERWLRLHATELRDVRGPDAAALIRTETLALSASARALGDAVFGDMLQVFGWQPREPTWQLGHRMTVELAAGK